MHETFLLDIRRTYRNYRTLAERAIAQIADEQLHHALIERPAQAPSGPIESGAPGSSDQSDEPPSDESDNTIAVIMQHVAGNLRSRFRDFLTADGEKPDRNRDGEFESRPSRARTAIMADWNEAWDIVCGELDRLTPDDLERNIYIRHEPFAVAEALNRSVTHTAYHVGQIVLLAKHFAGARWTSLSIPKGRSSEYGAGTFRQGILPRKGA
jgi:hypothetical protein